MNLKLLTGVRKLLFLTILKNPGITKAQLCAFSQARGGNLQRIGHHLMGLESEGFIEASYVKKQGKFGYFIAKGKGKRMLESLQISGQILDKDDNIYEKKH